ELTFAGVCTHLAVADEPDNPYTSEQLDRFDHVIAALHEEGLRPPLAHAANSAGLLVAGARYDLVRVGIACYGLPPAPALAVDLGDVPAAPDDEVVLIGRQGKEEITATEWGARLGTISYEVVTGIGARVPRTYLGETDRNRPM